jgi:type II secretory pathway pseudopilin PulG
LIEVILVMALIALALTLAGPRIGAGISRLELEQAAQSVRSLIKVGRVQAQRTDKEYYVVVNRERRSITLLGPDMRQLKSETLPSSVQFVQDSNLVSISIAPSGIVRAQALRLHGRVSDLEVALR